MQLRKLRRLSSTDIELLWDDGYLGTVSLKSLRDACPCAGCKGETILGEHYGPPPIDYDAPGRYELTSAVPVGNYALQFSWRDGHHDGIYSWDILRALCEGDVQGGRNAVPGGRA
jgi:DUF971 family protein